MAADASAIASRHGTVYVRIAPEIANDYKKFVKAQEIILGKLGCPCTSGFDIRWIQEENFVVNAAGDVRAGGM